jgi:ABC-type transport system involved in cytochrome bd biosynthesis fused ATPase/permease subunit
MLVGGLKKMKGTVFIGGKIAYKPEKVFFAKETVEENIRFYNKKVDSMQVRNIYKLLGLDKDLKYTDGLNMIIDDVNKFTLATL